MPPSDVVRRLSDDLARDPASESFLPLAELLARQGQSAAALRVARQGAARHARSAEAHALLARLALAEGAWEEGDAAWARAGELAASDVGRAAAHEGRAYACFRLGRLGEAARHLDAAAAAGADPQRIAAARSHMGARAGDAAHRTSRAIQPAFIGMPIL